MEDALTTLLSGAGFGLDRTNPPRNLTQGEIAFLDRDPAVLHNPASALRPLDLGAQERPDEIVRRDGAAQGP